MRALTLTTTGNISGFGRVSLPEPPRRVSSTRYTVLLRGQFEPDGDIATVLAACDEHPAVLEAKHKGKDNNYTFHLVVNTLRARDAHRFTYQVIDDLFRSIRRKVQVDLVTTPDAKPALHKRQPVGRKR